MWASLSCNATVKSPRPPPPALSLARPVAALSPCDNTDVTPRLLALLAAVRLPSPDASSQCPCRRTFHLTDSPRINSAIDAQSPSTPNARRPRRLISHGRGLTGTQSPPSTTAVEDAAMGHSTARAEWIWPLHRQGCHPDPFHRESAACLIVVSVARVPHRKGCRLQHTPPCGRRRVPLHVPFGGQPCSSSETFVNPSLPWWRLLIQS